MYLCIPRVAEQALLLTRRKFYKHLRMIPDEYERTEKDIAKVQLQRVLMLTSRLSLGGFLCSPEEIAQAYVQSSKSHNVDAMMSKIPGEDQTS
jgi:hypothetical protein